MTLKLNGTNSEAAPAYAGDDADTGLQCGTNELKLVTGGSARATVDSSGNVGIGTTSPTLSNNSTGIHIHGSGSGGSRLHLTDSNTGTAKSDGTEIVVSGSDLYIDQKENASTIFYTNGSERARILSSGGLTFNGDTAAANALNDYEEGNFTPTYGSGITSPSYSGTGGHYTKIGNLVTFTIRIRATGTNTSGQLKVAGLPFSSNTNNEGSVSFGYTDNMNAGDGILGHIPENSSEIHMYDFAADFFRGNNGNGVSAKTLHLRGFYYTNS